MQPAEAKLSISHQIMYSSHEVIFLLQVKCASLHETKRHSNEGSFSERCCVLLVIQPVCVSSRLGL